MTWCTHSMPIFVPITKSTHSKLSRSVASLLKIPLSFDLDQGVTRQHSKLRLSKSSRCFHSRSLRQCEATKLNHSMANHEPQAVQAREVIDRTFKYHPVTDSHSIRVLTLHPGTAGDRLSCTLVEETVSSDLDYEAVSYVWGKDSRRFELWCNGAALPITQSIRDALIRLRDPEKPRRLWADQICINQNDIVERSQQVQLMNIIYKNAKQVLVWLGRDHNGLAAGAVKMVHHLTKVFGDEELHREFRQAHSENLFDQDPTPWKPLSKLSQLPWVCLLHHILLSQDSVLRTSHIIDYSFHSLRSRGSTRVQEGFG